MQRRDCLLQLLGIGLGAAPLARAHEPVRLVTINNFTSKVNAVVLKEVYRRIGLDLIVASMPPSRVTAMAEQGEFDGEVNRIRAYGESHPTLIRVDPPISTWTVSAFYKSSSGLVLRSAADLAAHDVGIVHGIKAAADMTAAFPRVSVAPSSRELMLMLSGDRFEVAIDGTVESAFYIRRLGLPGIASVELSRHPLYHYLHEKKKPLAPAVSREIQKLADTGELKAMFEAASAALQDSGAKP